MSVKSGQAVTVLFSTANATTGAATDATGTPTGTLYVNGTADGATVTVTNITTGVYKAAVTLPSLSAGDVVSLRAAATVSTVAGEGIIWQDVADTVRLSDVSANVDDILVDTGTTLDTLIKDIPTVDEFEARTLAAADYATATALATVDDFLDTEIAAILEDTGTTLPNQLAGLNDLDATEVQTAAAAALTAYDPPTKAELDAADDAVLAAIALLNNLSSAGAQAAAAAALAAYDAATGTDVTSATSGLSTFDATTDAVTVGTIQADAITAGAIATAAAQEIADAVLSRGVGNVEATADEHSLTAIVLAALESAIVGTDWTIYRTDGATTFTTKTVTVDASADPITAVE